MSRSRQMIFSAACLSWFLSLSVTQAQTPLDSRLEDAAAVITEFSGEDGIPEELINRAYGVAVIPGVIRGGFILGGRRGKGALMVRTADGGWSAPAFIQLTGGSIGWQIGVESADVILVFANEAAVRNIERGKFTLGGDASAIAGPLGRRNTAALTFRAEVYAYVRGTGLFAGAAFEGARLAMDADANAAYYTTQTALPLGADSSGVPMSARRLLLSMGQLGSAATAPGTRSGQMNTDSGAEDAPARTFPLEGAP